MHMIINGNNVFRWILPNRVAKEIPIPQKEKTQKEGFSGIIQQKQPKDIGPIGTVDKIWDYNIWDWKCGEWASV